MKILIVSDTHGRNLNFYEAVDREAPIDLIIHLGDICGLEEEIEMVTGVPCYAVAGNNDYYSFLPSESVIMVGKHRTLITHGHEHGVDYSTRDLRHYAHGIDCDIAMYGHTHVPEIDDSGEVLILNPGSLSRPRQSGRRPTYIVGITDEKGDATFEIKEL